MTVELITRLGEQESLRVISEWSSSRVDTSLSIPEIARRLNVQGLVEGWMTISKDGMRYSARLIRARDEERVWSDDHTVPKGDVLEASNRFARSILKELGFSPVKKRSEPVDPITFQLYLDGRQQWSRRTEDGVRASIELFNTAIARDDRYAEAYSGLADAYTTAGHMGLESPRKAYAQAKEAALQALDLDSTRSEGYVSLANLRQNFDWDWAWAKRDFERAIELNDNNAVAHHWYSNLLAYRGDFAGAREQIRRARELDPLSTAVKVGAGACEYLARQYDRAIDTLLKVVEADRGSDLPYRVMAGAYYQLGRNAEAANAIGRWIAIKYPPLSDSAARGYRRAGLPGMARVLLDVMTREKRDGRYVPATHLAELSIVAGDLEAALRWLEVASSEHDTELNRLKVDPIFDPLRGNPRFAELLRKVRLDT
jgi:tetratricopeptide (TPR) repeat protein